MDHIDSNTELAVERTRLSYERTLMSWVRTATSLITFGFTIYKFFQIERDRGSSRGDRLVGPTEFALLMILIGLVAGDGLIGTPAGSECVEREVSWGPAFTRESARGVDFTPRPVSLGYDRVSTVRRGAARRERCSRPPPRRRPPARR